MNPTTGIGGPKPADNVDPIFDYVQGNSTGRAITGGYVYRGTARDDSDNPLDGHYFFGDYVSGRIWSLAYDGSTVSQFVKVSGLLQPRDASCPAVWSSIEAIQLSIGVASAVAVTYRP